MKQEGSIALFQYWNALRDGRPAPRRAEVEPAAIRKLLADTLILERDGRGEAVFRLAGTRLCAIHGRELKGFSFSSLWRPRDQRLMSKLVASTFTTHSVAIVEYRGTSEKGRSLPFEMLLLPLDGGVETPRCLGIAEATETAFWLGADPIVSAEIETMRVLDPDREPMFLKNRPAVSVPPLVPEEALFEPDGVNGRRVRHLMVLDGGKELSS